MTVQLLQYTDPQIWAFEHQMDTRQWIALWGVTRTSYTQIPYQLDTLNTDATWQLNHATSHSDVASPPPTPAGPFGAPVTQNLLTGSAQPSKADPWFLLQNLVEHRLVIENTMQNQWTLYYPFW